MEVTMSSRTRGTRARVTQTGLPSQLYRSTCVFRFLEAFAISKGSPRIKTRPGHLPPTFPWFCFRRSRGWRPEVWLPVGGQEDARGWRGRPAEHEATTHIGALPGTYGPRFCQSDCRTHRQRINIIDGNIQILAAHRFRTTSGVNPYLTRGRKELLT